MSFCICLYSFHIGLIFPFDVQNSNLQEWYTNFFLPTLFPLKIVLVSKYLRKYINLGDTANVDETPESLISESTESLCSQSEGTKTDTTICSRVAINYEETPRVRNKAGRRVHVVTKANQATTTDKAEVCDVSTLTNDWWSPIEERKVAKQNKYREASRKKTPCTKHKGISTGDGRIVKFKSEAQIIPSGNFYLFFPLYIRGLVIKSRLHNFYAPLF